MISSRIEIVNAEDVIETGEPPVMAIRRKKESSLVKAMYMVKNKEADAFVSAGSSGAILVGGQTIVGRLRGVDRPPMAALIPTKDGVFTACRQRCQCRCKSNDACTVGCYGFYIHGECCWR